MKDFHKIKFSIFLLLIVLIIFNSNAQEGTIKLNFQNSSIKDFVEFYSKLKNKIVLLPEKFQGSVSIIARDLVTIAEVNKIFGLVLDQRGYAFVEDDEIIRIFDKKTASAEGLPLFSDAKEISNFSVGIIKLNYLKSDDLASNLRVLVSSDGNISSSKEINSLIVTDKKENIQKIENIVTAMDQQNNYLQTEVITLNYNDAKTVQGSIDKLWTAKYGEESRFAIELDESTNSLIFLSSEEALKDAEKIIKKLDIRKRQVLLEVEIAEITHTDSDQIGTEWEFSGTKWNALHNLSAGTGLSGGKIDGLEGIKYAVSKDDDKGFIRALNSLDKVNILSKPNVVVMDNQKATLNIGQEVPILKEYRLDSNNNPIKTYEQKQVGIDVEITPQISESRDVTLNIQANIDKILSEPTSDELAYVFGKRSVNTSVVVKDQHTLVIGGLIKDDLSETRKSVPLISKIPILNLLFGGETKKQEKTELVILITPYVIADDLDGKNASLQEKMKLKKIMDLKGEVFDF